MPEYNSSALISKQFACRTFSLYYSYALARSCSYCSAIILNDWHVEWLPHIILISLLDLLVISMPQYIFSSIYYLGPILKWNFFSINVVAALGCMDYIWLPLVLKHLVAMHSILEVETQTSFRLVINECFGNVQLTLDLLVQSSNQPEVIGWFGAGINAFNDCS